MEQMQEMADQCAEMMRLMGASGMHGETGGMVGPASMGGMGMGGMGSMMLMPGWTWFLVVLLLLIGVAVASVVLTRMRLGDRAPRDGDPFDELGRRYARGEVERDVYLQIRDDLRGARG